MKTTIKKNERSFLSTLLLLSIMLSFFSLNAVAHESDKVSTQNFIEQASVKSLTAIQSAENALESTKSQSVSAYAQKMINEYKKIRSDILKLADEKDIDMTKKSVVEEAAEEIAVQTRDNDTFDVAYARNQIAVHQHTISLFQRAAKLEDYDTRMFATSTLLHLQRHLQMAEQLYAATAETKTDIHQDRKNQVDYSDEDEIHRRPSTDKSVR